jgi:hypothetical protein
MQSPSGARIALLAVALSLPAFARPKTDVIVMSNGDRLTCEIRGLEGGLLSVRLEYVPGTITIDWSKVQRLESSQLFAVETESGTTYTGSLKTVESPGDQPRKIEVVNDDPGRDAVVEQGRVIGAAQYGESFWSRIQGNFSTGLIYSKANATTQYNLGSDLNYRRERSTVELSYSSALSTSGGATTATRNQLDLQASRLLRWNNWYYAGIFSFLQSSSQGISSQNTYGGGIGRYLRKTNTTQISITSGIGALDSHYNNRPTQNNLVGLIAGNVNLFQFEKTELTISPTLYPSLNDLGRVRFNLNAQYKVRIVTGLWWNITLYGNWDNRAPMGLVGSDYGTSVGLTYRLH